MNDGKSKAGVSSRKQTNKKAALIPTQSSNRSEAKKFGLTNGTLCLKEKKETRGKKESKKKEKANEWSLLQILVGFHVGETSHFAVGRGNPISYAPHSSLSLLSPLSQCRGFISPPVRLALV